MPCLADGIRHIDSSLQELVAAVEQAPSLDLMILAAWQLAHQLAVLLVQEVLTQRAQQPTAWPTCPRYGGRQHYLRFKVPDTWRHWEQAGLAYDASMIFPDLNGFRCGTCHPFQPFDVERNRGLDLLEYPLVVMDVTLRRNRRSPQDGRSEILHLANRCREVHGTFSMLWHNTSMYGDWRPWREMYEAVIPELAAMMKKQGGKNVR